MKRRHSPIMDDLELQNSPRKKPKLEGSPLDLTAAETDTSTNVPVIPAVIPHNHTATANLPLTEPITVNPAATPSSTHISAATAHIPISPSAVPGAQMDDSFNHSEAQSNLVDQRITNISDPQSAFPNGADTVDDRYSKEEACGITEFVSADLLCFSGILKKRYGFLVITIDLLADLNRYTDFLVNEILPSGEVIHLDNLKAPPKPHEDSRLPRNAAEVSSANPTDQQVEAPLPNTTTIKTEKQQPNTAFKATHNDEKQTSHPITSNHEQSTVLSKDNLPETEASHSLPHSMQDFDKYEPTPESTRHDQDKISPHKRVPPPVPSIPQSMQDLDGKEPELKQEKRTRRKEKVHIRQTSQGWEEFDKKKEDEIKKRKAQEDAAAGVQPEEDVKIEDTKPEKTTNGGEHREVDSVQAPKESTQALWQAFAGSAPSSSFQVSLQIIPRDNLLISPQLRPEDKNTLLSYFSPSIVEEILALYDRIVDSPHRKTRDYGMVTSGVIDRQKRTTIHQDIRRIFDSRLETMTEDNGAIVITAMTEKPSFYARTPMNTNTRNNGRGDHRGNSRGNSQAGGRRNDDRSRTQISGGGRGKPSWEDLGGRYLHFSLYKENKDTMEAISWLSKQLRMSPRSFQFAGTKDRRAVTVQRVSVDRVLINAMIPAGRTLRNAHIGNFEYRPHPLQLGELAGNEFVITLRDCDFHYPIPLDAKLIVQGAQIIVGEAIDGLRERGFINYYGLQRFGSFSIGTEAVGLKMLQGDFQGAVDAILDYSPASLAAAQNSVSGNTDKVSMDDRARAHALHSFKTTNRAGQALHELPRKYSAESCIIRHLTGRPDHREDYMGALQTIPRNLRLMYVHAYQSLVWNVAASHRWKRFGSNVIEGDLVLVNDHTDKVEDVVKAEEVDADGEAIVLPDSEDRAINPDDIFERARALTKEEADSGKYSIFDIVLPTPGYDILYPANEIGKFYEEFMASERGGGLNPHDMRRQWKDISLSGSYRKVLARPSADISFEIKTYKNDDEQFVQTDIDRMGLGAKSQRNGHPRPTPQNLAQQDTAPSSSLEDKQDSTPAHEDNPTDTKQHNDFNKNKNNEAPNGNDPARTKTPSQESEDMEEGGVSLIGGDRHDYKLAVVLKLQLGASQYATMALRELLKAGGLKTYKADFSGGR